MKPLHILHTEASLGWGGQEIRILTEAEGMIARGHHVTLIAPPDANIRREGEARGIPTLALPIGKKRLGGLFELRKWLKTHPCDVINTHSSTDTWLAALACATLSDPPPLVRTRHISAPVPDNFSSRWLYNAATRFIATTGEKLREQMMREVHVAAGRVESVPTGIDLTRFHPDDRAVKRAELGLPADAFIVGIVATLRSWKGHRYLLEALQPLTDIHLVVAGDGPQRAALEAQVESLGMKSRVRFVGNQKNVPPWLQSFDIFVLPSYANEGVPQALMQAMACGLPVVSTPVGSIDEIVTDGETGLMVAPQDVITLRAAIEKLKSDAPLRSALGAAALARARERFSADLMVARMERIFALAAAGATRLDGAGASGD
ncbi:MAG: glycosyltransferase family 4 protein [Betaproteobacteria bacterium]|nr:glycosyltransferase family 4 protein [Betaproteobacteria bacterium]